MDNKLSLDTGGLYLMREHASIDPVYGPYNTILSAENALTGDYAEVVKPGLQFAVSDGNGKYKQYILNSLDPFDYSEIGSDIPQFEVGDTLSITWGTDASGEHYASVVVGSGLAIDDHHGVIVNHGNGLHIGSGNALSVSVGSGITILPNGNISLDAQRSEWTGERSRIVLSSSQDKPIVLLGSGLVNNGAGAVDVNVGAGIVLDEHDGSVAISSDVATNIPIGSGLTRRDIRISSSYSQPSLEVKIGTGLEFDEDGSIKTAVGTTLLAEEPLYVVNNNTIRLAFGNGLELGSSPTGNKLSVYLSSGLLFALDGSVRLQIGQGLRISDQNNLNVEIGSGIMVSNGNEIMSSIGGGLTFDNNKAISVDAGDGLILNYGKVVLRRKDNSLVFDNGATKVNLDGTTLHLDSNDKVSANIDNDSIVYNSTSQRVQTKGVAIQFKQGADWATAGSTTAGSPKIRLGSGILAIVVGTDTIQFDLDTTYLDTLYQRVS